MAIQVLQQPSHISFSGDPIIVKAKTTLTGKTFLRIKLKVNAQAYRSGESNSYSEGYIYEVSSDGVAVFNIGETISTALKRCMTCEVSGTTVTQKSYAVSYTLTYTEAFLEDMVEIEEGEVTSQTYNAIPGKLTEFERMTAGNSDTSSLIGSGRILSRKPSGDRIIKGIDWYIPAVKTSGDTISYTVVQGDTRNSGSQYTGGSLVPASIKIDTSSLLTGEVIVSTSEDTGKKHYVVQPFVGMRHFLFLNKFGLVESVTAVARESLSYSIDSELYSVPVDVNFRQNTQVMNYAQEPFASLAMSSGFVTREWAEWWINEFLVTRKAWMMVDGIFLPVAIVPEETNEIYDRSKPSLIAVNFTVRFSFTGGTFNSFVR